MGRERDRFPMAWLYAAWCAGVALLIWLVTARAT